LYARPSLGFSWGAGVHAGYERTRACVNNPGKYRALDPPVRDNQPVSKRPGMIKLQRIMPWYRWDAPREDGRVFYISMYAFVPSVFSVQCVLRWSLIMCMCAFVRTATSFHASWHVADKHAVRPPVCVLTDMQTMHLSLL
jgi:hypothetical protein